MPDYLTSSNEVAEVCGITSRRLEQLIKQGHIPSACRPKHGTYDLALTTKYYIEFLKAQGALSRNVNETSGIDPREERAKLHRQQRFKVELENARQKKELLLFSEVLNALEILQGLYNNQIDALEGRLVPNLVFATQSEADVILSIVRPEIVAIRNETAHKIESLAHSFAAIPDSAAAPANSPVAVGGTPSDTPARVR